MNKKYYLTWKDTIIKYYNAIILKTLKGDMVKTLTTCLFGIFTLPNIAVKRKYMIEKHISFMCM